MIKVIFCLRRRADMSLEDFQRYWREVHGPLVAKHRQALRIVSLAGGRLAEIARFESARGPIVTDILAIDLTRDGRPDLVYGTEEGFLGAVFHR